MKSTGWVDEETPLFYTRILATVLSVFQRSVNNCADNRAYSRISVNLPTGMLQRSVTLDVVTTSGGSQQPGTVRIAK